MGNGHCPANDQFGVPCQQGLLSDTMGFKPCEKPVKSCKKGPVLWGICHSGPTCHKSGGSFISACLSPLFLTSLLEERSKVNSINEVLSVPVCQGGGGIPRFWACPLQPLLPRPRPKTIATGAGSLKETCGIWHRYSGMPRVVTSTQVRAPSQQALETPTVRRSDPAEPSSLGGVLTGWEARRR